MRSEKQGAKLSRLELDFVRRRRGSPWAGRLLLAVAVAFSADVGLSYVKLNGQVLEAQTRLSRNEFQSPGTSAEDLAAARDTVQRLSTPWASLFGAIESAASDQVALLAIEPDPKAGTVLISGDGKDYLAALTYVLNLSRSEALSGVQLLRHEARPDAVGFSVSAAWKKS